MAYDLTKLLRLKHLKQLAEIVKDNKDAIEILQDLVGTEDIASQIQDAIDGVIGDPSDDETLNTLYGIKALANTKVKLVSAGDDSIVVGGTSTQPTISIAISQEPGNNLNLEDDGLFVTVPSASEYTIIQKATPNQGFLTSYQLTKNGVATGVDINIPKDFLVKSGTLETVEETDVPYQGAVVGDKYLDFVINTEGDDETPQHIYIPINDLVDAYIAGFGIAISNNNEISVEIDENNSNGLSVSDGGLAIGLASENSNGAMSSAQYTKITNISQDANKVEVPDVWDGTISVDGASEAVVEIATDNEVATMLEDIFPRHTVFVDDSQPTGVREAIAEVLAAGSNLTTVRLTDDTESYGIMLPENSALTINFDDNTLEPIPDENGDYAGSTGTKTQAMQLLKGSTVVLRNGRITGNSGTPQTKMVIQNYSNLTLDNMVVQDDGTDTYVLSNNFGEVHLTNGTQINAVGNHVAFDLWYGMAATYDDGVTVYIDTPDVVINGPIEFGHAGRIKNEEQFLERTHLYVCKNYDLSQLQIINSTAGSTTQYHFVMNDAIGYYELVPVE